MSSHRHKQHSRSQASSQTEEWPEKMKATQACKFLGISTGKMTKMLASGQIKYERHLLDDRAKVIKRSDLEELLRNIS